MSVPNILLYNNVCISWHFQNVKHNLQTKKKFEKVQTVQTELSIKDRKYKLTLKLLGISEKWYVIQSLN